MLSDTIVTSRVAPARFRHQDGLNSESTKFSHDGRQVLLILFRRYAAVLLPLIDIAVVRSIHHRHDGWFQRENITTQSGECLIRAFSSDALINDINIMPGFTQ